MGGGGLLNTLYNGHGSEMTSEMQFYQPWRMALIKNMIEWRCNYARISNFCHCDVVTCSVEGDLMLNNFGSRDGFYENKFVPKHTLCLNICRLYFIPLIFEYEIFPKQSSCIENSAHHSYSVKTWNLEWKKTTRFAKSNMGDNSF